MSKILRHDQFFLKTFSDKKSVQVFLKDSLPEKLTARLDLDHIEFEECTVVDSSLSKNIPDLVIKTRVRSNKDPVDIYLLFEHKAHRDKNVLFQILRYMLNMWEKDLHEKKKPRIIIPYIFYHGKKRWKIKKFRDIFSNDPEINKRMIDLPFELFDTSRWDPEKSPEDFARDIKLKISIEIMKKSFKMNAQTMKEILLTLSKLGFFENFDKNSYMVLYLIGSSNVAKEEFVNIIEEVKSVDHSLEDKMQTLGDILKQEGRQEGIQKGMQKGIMQACRKALRCKIPVEIVSSITGLSVKKVLEIKKELSESEEDK
ncbi:MAG: Rpn family recombination-promoting nuclease/putative transposase [bacterium]